MLTKRLIACFDIIDGRVTKAHKFQNNIDIDSAQIMAKKMYQDQVDEIIFYDIKASAEKRQIDIPVVEAVAEKVFVPFTVGGGISSLKDMHAALDAGAEKISIDSMAVRQPSLITDGAEAFGRQCVVLSMQVIRREFSSTLPSGYEIAIDGARVFTGKDAVTWAQEGEKLGAGEIVVNSIDKDGTHTGYDLDITKKIAAIVDIPVIASGGAGTPEHIVEVFQETKAQAAIISSMLYSPKISRNYSIEEIKTELVRQGILMRPFTPR